VLRLVRFVFRVRKAAIGVAGNSKAKEKVMSDNTNTNEQATTGKSPSHFVYHVRVIEGRDKGFWTRIGSAWAHNDGKGFNVQLEGLVPLDGRITLRVPSEKKD